MNDKTQIAEVKNKDIQQVATINEDSSALVLVASAIAGGADHNSVEQMIELIKFNDERESEKAFNIAFTEAQSEFPEIKKTKKGHNSKYAPYDEVVKSIRPTLKENGLSFRHDIKTVEGLIYVTCILAHKKGYSVTANLSGAPDTSGKKQPIQATASTVSYLKRYTLESVTGVSTSDEDTDGFVAPQPPELVTEEQVLKIDSFVLDNEIDGNYQRILDYLKISGTKDISANLFDETMKKLKQAAEAK